MIVQILQNDVHFILKSITLTSISGAGPMGIIAASYLEQPFETAAKIKKYLR